LIEVFSQLFKLGVCFFEIIITIELGWLFISLALKKYFLKTVFEFFFSYISIIAIILPILLIPVTGLTILISTPLLVI